MPRSRNADAKPAKPPSRPGAAGEPAASEAAEEERVHDAIVEAVMSQRLPPGTRLVEAPLCEAFGVNRTLLRRVLVRLAAGKVVELYHNRGAIVAQPGQAEVHKVFEVRRLIEGGVLRALGRRRITAAELTPVRALVKKEHAAHDRGDRLQWIRLSGEFHLQVGRLLGNDELVDILRSLVARTTLMKAMYEAPGRNVCSFHEHLHILDALESGDAEQACTLMEHHLEAAESQLRRDAPGPEVDLMALFGRG